MIRRRDLENTPDSVFCAHGAGYPVKWYKVPEFAHVEYAGVGTSDLMLYWSLLILSKSGHDSRFEC